MKKLLFLSSILLLGFVACVGPEGPEGPRGPAGKDGRDGGGAHVYIQDVPVATGDWIWDNGYYWCTKNVSFIDQYIYDVGVIKVYIDYGVMQQELPVVRHYGDGEFLWTRTTDYEFGIGKITFYVTNSDFFNERPEEMLFRVTIVWEEGL